MTTKPSLALIPSGYKASKVYSVLPSNGLGDFPFSRTTKATRLNKDGLIENVDENVPRLDYSDGGCPSLLLEPSRSNLNTYSDPKDSQKGSTSYSSITYQDNYNWGLGNVINNAIVFGDNSTTRYAYYNSSVVSGTEYTLSFIIKMNDNSVPIPATDFLMVLAGTSFASGYNVESYGNNIYRISVSGTAGASNTANGILKVASNSTKGFTISGFQLEQGSYATSYIPTNGDIKTRSVDNVRNFQPNYWQTLGGIPYIDANGDSVDDDMYNGSEGVLYFEMKPSALDGTKKIITLSSGYIHNRIILGYNTNNSLIASVYNKGKWQSVLGSQYQDIDKFNKIALKYKENDFSLFINGVEVNTDAKGSVFGVDTLRILRFSGVGGDYPFYGSIRKFMYFDVALSSTELIDLTK